MKTKLKTRMYSSRMLTAHLLIVSHSIQWGGGGKGVCPTPWMQTARMQNPLDVDPSLDEDTSGCRPPGCRPPDACWEAKPPQSPSPVEMFVKTLPCPKLRLRAVINISWMPFSVKYCNRNKEINAKNIDL